MSEPFVNDGPMVRSNTYKNNNALRLSINHAILQELPEEHSHFIFNTNKIHPLSDTQSGSLSADTSFGDVMEQQKGFKAFLRRCCPAIHSLQNILLVIFLLQTAICIGAMILLFYTSGENIVQEMSTVRERNIELQVRSYISTAPDILFQIKKSFKMQSVQANNSVAGTVDDYSSVHYIFGPIKEAYKSSTMFLYGNSLGDYAAFEINPSRRVLQMRYHNATVINYYFDEYYHPIGYHSQTDNYYPHKRLWYVGALQSYPNPSWSPIYLNYFYNCISLSLAVKFNFPTYYTSNGIRSQTTEVIAAHFDLYNIDNLIRDTLMLNKDSLTGSIGVAIVERNGNLISTAFTTNEKVNMLTENGTRVHLSNGNNLFKTVATTLEELKLIYPVGKNNSNFNLITPNVTSFWSGNFRVSVYSITDGFGLDWLLIVCTNNYGFVNIIFGSSPAVLSISIVLIIVGTLVMVVVTQIITKSIWKVSSDMYTLSKMEIDSIKEHKALNVMYELGLLQKSIKSVKNGFTSFMKYIPREIVKAVVQSGSKAKLGVVNANTSVMFTDIADFTTFTETSSIPILLKVITGYFEAVTSSVEACGGQVDKFIGDGTMSIFSNPFHPLDDHAVKVCRAALLTAYNIDKIKIKNQQDGLPYVKIRIGCNTGNAMIGNIGSKERFNYTAIGDTVNTSARLEALNKRYDTKILIGEATYNQVASKFLCFFVDVVRLKGKNQTTQVYTLVCEWSESTPLQKQIHSILLKVRDDMIQRNYGFMKEKLNELAEILFSVKNQSMNEGKEDTLDYRFVFELQKRAEQLVGLNKHEDSDFTLTLHEK
ncbi:hypothetical protein ABK040_005169 [Willaertia magna]